MKRWIARAIIPLVVAIGGGYWAFITPRSTERPSVTATLEGVDLERREAVDRPPDWPDYSDSVVFDALVEKLRANTVRLESEWQSLPHVQTRLNDQLDASGKATFSERTVEKVWHEAGVEKRELVEWFDVLANVPKDPAKSSLPPVQKSALIYPFFDSRAAPQYRYSLAGYAKYGSTSALEVAFEPLEPVADKLRGVYAFDPVAMAPLRMTATMAQLPALVDSLTMISEYGRTESGLWQLRRWISDGKGGVAFLRKHYRVETRYEKYGRQAAADSN